MIYQASGSARSDKALSENLSKELRVSNRSAEPVSRPSLLHVFPTFAWGGVPIRITTIINHFGNRYRHTILSLDGACDSRSRLDPGIEAKVTPFPHSASTLPFRLTRYRKAIAGFAPDLLLTYNWGAIEWAMANSLSPLCRHVHMESGFGPEEANGQLTRRVLFRRLALRRTERLIVPSTTLYDLATRVWKLDPARVSHIPNGVDCAKFAVGKDALPSPEVQGATPEIVVGTVAPLRREKNLARLVRAFATVAGHYRSRLLIVGDGPEKARLESLAAELGITHQVTFTGHVEAVEESLAGFDIFAISSDTEQMPNSVLQAMAAGLPVVGTDVGDVKLMLAPENRPFVAAAGDDVGFRSSLDKLMADETARVHLGGKNRAHVEATYNQEKMFRAYEAVFTNA